MENDTDLGSRPSRHSSRLPIVRTVRGAAGEELINEDLCPDCEFYPLRHAGRIMGTLYYETWECPRCGWKGDYNY